MQKLQRAMTGYLIIVLCFFSMVSESMAENRVFSGESGNWKRGEEVVVSWGDEPTRVKIIGNAVLVPVTLMYGGNEADVNLLLDTGSSGTAIHTEIADRLSINLNRSRKTKVQVVGGGILEAHVVRVSSLTVGPHTKRNWNVFVVPHKSSVVRYDGLLGMDVLRGLKYEVDFKKKVIIWE